MTTNDLEILLESGTESQTVDFKASCAWEASSFAQDILAMTNVQEGGSIIVGVSQGKDGSFERKGITPEHRETYKEDDMKDDIAPYADPHVNFAVSFLRDKEEKEYVVIIVEPFKEIPVICIKDSKHTRDKGIYYRNRDGKVESGLVSNAYDLKDILERSAIKLMNRARTIGYPTSGEDTSLKAIKERLKKERGEL